MKSDKKNEAKRLKHTHNIHKHTHINEGTRIHTIAHKDHIEWKSEIRVPQDLAKASIRRIRKIADTPFAVLL